MTRVSSMVLALCIAGTPALAQTLDPNPAGVSAGHQHLRGLDGAANTAFWTALGATPAQLAGGTQIMKLPGVFIMFADASGRGRRGGGPAAAGAAGAPAATPAPAPVPPAGSEGSTVDALAFKVKNLAESLAAWRAAGIVPQPGGTPTQAVLMAPNGVKVQVVEDASIATPIAASELVMRVPNVADAAAWYEKWFGAEIVKIGGTTVARIPGSDIRFVETQEPLAGTAGRALDHIGFEVKGLQALMTRLAEGGVTVNRGYATASAGLAPLKALAFVTDPWGTYIELTEGFADIP